MIRGLSRLGTRAPRHVIFQRSLRTPAKATLDAIGYRTNLLALPRFTRPVPSRSITNAVLNTPRSLTFAVGSAFGLGALAFGPSQFKMAHCDSGSAGAVLATPESMTETAAAKFSELMAELCAEKVSVIRLIIRCFKLAFLFGPLVVTSPFVLMGPVPRFLPRIIDWWWRWLTWAVDKSGVTFTKLGQWASTRPDILSQEVCDRLSALQQDVTPHSIKETHACIENAFGKSIDELFVYLSTVPLASGAVAQVYRGRLREGGQDVAVKVRHPGVPLEVATDLYIMYTGAMIINSIPTLHWLSLPEAVTEFAESMMSQLDLRIEAQNLIQLRKNFDREGLAVRFPMPVSGLVSDDVIIESYERGVPMSNVLSDTSHAFTRAEKARLAQLGLNIFLKMMISHNFTHSDLHPGNILVDMSNEGRPALVILDAGLVTELSPYDRESFVALFKSIATGDTAHGAELMIDRARSHECTDREGYKHELTRLMDEATSVPLHEVEVGATLSAIVNLARKYKVKIEPNFCTLCVGIIVLEGIGRQLDPNISLLTHAIPFLVRAEPRAAAEVAAEMATWKRRRPPS